MTPMAQEPGRNPPRRRWIKWTVIVLGAVLALAALLAMALPSLISSGPGTRWALELVNASLPGKAEIADLSLGWFSGQHLEGLKLLDPQGRPVLSVRRLDAPDVRLWDLLTGGQRYGTVTVDGLDVRIVQEPDGQTNLQQALGGGQPAEARESTGGGVVPLGLRVAVVVKNAELLYAPVGMQPVRLAGLEGSLSALEPQLFEAQFATDVQQGQDRGRVRATVTLRNLVGADGHLQPRQAQLHVQVDISQLPVGAVDRLMNKGGALVELLGPLLEAHVQADGALLAPRAQVKASSANLQVFADLTVEDGAVVVAPQTGAQLTITPAAFDALLRTPMTASSSQPRLTQPVRVELTVPRGRLVRGPDGLLHWPLAELAAQVRATDVRLSGVGQEGSEVALRNPSAEFALDGQQQQVRAQLAAVVEHNNSQGPIRAEATVAYPLDARGRPQWSRSQVQATLQAPQIPTALIDAAIGGQGLANEALGPILSAHAQAQWQPGQGQQASTGTVQISARAVYLRQAGLSATVQDGKLVVQPGTLAEWQLTPGLMARVAQQVPALQGLGLRQASGVTVQVRELSVPVQPLDVRQARLELALALDRTALSGEWPYNAMALGPLTVQAGPGVLGEALPLVIQAQGALGDSQGQVSLRGQVLDPLGSRVLHVQGQMQASLAPDVTPSSTDGPRLMRPVQPALDIKQLRLPLGAGASLADASLELTGQVPQAQLAAPKIAEVGVRDLRLELQVPRLGEALQATAKGQFTSPQGGGHLDANVQVRRPLEAGRQVMAKLEAQALPVAVLEALTGDGRLGSLIGDTVQSLQLHVQTQADSQVAFTAGIVAPHLRSDLAGSYKAGDFLRVQDNPQAVELELTPEAFAALQPPRKPLQLLQPVRVTVGLGETIIGLRPVSAEETAGPMDWSRVKLAAQVKSSPLVLRSDGQPPFTLEGLDADIRTQDLRQELAVKLLGEVVSTAAGGEPVRRPMTSDTRVLGLVGAHGAINTAQVRVRTQTQLDDIPTAIAVAAVGADPSYVGVIGPTMTLQAWGHVPGDLDVKLTSPNVKAPVSATLTDDRRLRLRKDAVIEVAVTPELSQTLLKFGSPLLVDAQDSQQPIRLTLRSGGFDVPLANFDLKQATLAADLELGTLRMKRGWARGSVEELVRTVAGVLQARLPLEQGEELEPMNFTPLRATLAQGVVSTNDLWMWNPQTAMGVQGKINLAEQKLNMTMGLLGEGLLRRIPALKRLRAIQPEAVYEFAVTGPLSSPKVDFGKFAAQVAVAAGIAQAGRQGGELGQVLGEVLGGVVEGGRAGPLAGGRLSWPGRPTLPALETDAAATETQQPSSAAQQPPPSQQPQQEQPPKRNGAGLLLEGILQGLEQQEQREK